MTTRPRSHELFASARRRIPGGVNSPVRAFRGVGGEPFFVNHAEGARIRDIDGNEYIDYVGTWGPAILGHAPKVVTDAVRAAAEHGLSYGIPNPLEVEMAELICNWVPSVEKVRMVNSGTEATMSCVRLARGYTGRDKIVKFEGCYHGHVDSLLVRAGYLAKLRELCTAHRALLIFDEVMTGFRVAKGGVQELTGVTPDLTAMGKVIGGGLPVGAFGGRADVMDCLSPDGPVYQAGTLSGNPLAMAAGLAQLRKLERSGGWEHLEKLGAQFEAGVRDALAANGLPYAFHRMGSMFCLFFTEGPVRDLAEAKKSDTARFAKFFHYCLEHGVYFAPSQFETGFISTAHTADDMDRTAKVVTAALRHAA